MARRSWRRGPKISKPRWARVRQQVFRRDGFRCVDCLGAGALECDHVVPLWVNPHQDPYDMDGLASRCRTCHLKKTRRENGPVDVEREQWRELVSTL